MDSVSEFWASIPMLSEISAVLCILLAAFSTHRHARCRFSRMRAAMRNFAPEALAICSTSACDLRSSLSSLICRAPGLRRISRTTLLSRL